MMSLSRSAFESLRAPLRQPSSFRFFSSLNTDVVPSDTPSDISSTPKSNNKKEGAVLRHTKKDIPAKIPPMNVHLAVTRVRDQAWAKFDESFEVAVNLGVDPRKPGQSVKSVAKLPHGSGKKVRVAVFASGAEAAAAIAAGADIVGAEDLIMRVQKGELPFDTVIATPEMMSQVSKIGRILGPRGMMPNPKLGTVTKDVAKAILAAKAGAVQFRVEKNGIVQVAIGKLSFTDEMLLDNLRSFMVAITDCKPEGLKGKYIECVHVSSTMGPGVEIATQNVDPSNAKFMLDPTKMGKMK